MFIFIEIVMTSKLVVSSMIHITLSYFLLWLIHVSFEVLLSVFGKYSSVSYSWAYFAIDLL